MVVNSPCMAVFAKMCEVTRIQGVGPEFAEEIFCLLDEQHSRGGPSSANCSSIRPGVILGLLIFGPLTNALLVDRITLIGPPLDPCLPPIVAVRCSRRQQE